MIELVKTNIDSIKNACKNMQVKSLYLFGSATKKQSLMTKATWILFSAL